MKAMARKWGNSIGIRIPASMANSIKINDGTPIDVELDGEKIIITRKKYNLKELLAQIPDDYVPEEIDWGEPVGGEIW
ncbi:AbrB/MazE/SpoVT family DNA-binding domain-containing protein [Desulfosporosinus sp. BICA1-9]|uniref:AbrB/MazE/SpoVT family DNA-binding domain-containing protein n=1 Tax=Desulfosporosinus sp. BICA1-9 TaxID=1531958 RepID=UPI00054B42DB|nr:AbrB/MazE/SpoVT family DNA-binding domain-containing protein [Desulfosporosinus sp. BICA1-9]KJS46786.1 MAG: multidrug transporter MatE [Peptococcaceae bacterium BRH_c23]KJS88962.1 MAG: multidrug transporter MatE [Desulfosporosinus sp. BICA1-9]HBW36533.1 AbrB/MazE/SpoVT family DNA-binding domain-containing protein [Desulfosporosinus sp.]